MAGEILELSLRYIPIKSAFSTDHAQKASAASYAAPLQLPPAVLAVLTTSLAGNFLVLLPLPSVTGHIEEYDEYDGGSDAE
jgi:hypothetical protein